MERIEVRLLGQLLVRRSDGSVVAPDEWRTTRTTDLLRLLALDAGQPVATHVVIDRLWPNVASERGRASLRTAASQLRKVLRADCLERRAGALVLHGAWVDTQAYDGLVTRLDAARRAGEHAEVVALAQQAEALYRGDVDAPDASGDWLHEVRDRLRRTRCRALLDASNAAACLGWMRDSLDLARQAVELEESEEAARALMRAYAGMGEVPKAMQVFDRLRTDLAEQLGVDPSPQTRALHLQLLTGTAAAATAPRRLVGHEESVNAMVAAITSGLDSGEGSLVWLRGEPGSGRDSVVEAACATMGLSVHNMNHDPLWVKEAAPGEPWDMPAADVIVMPAARDVPRHARVVLRSLMERHGGVLVVPVRRTSPTEQVGGERVATGTLVDVGPLTGEDFDELARQVLQGEPTARLVQRLRAASAGLSGTACRVARRWLGEGRIVWTEDGLDLVAGRGLAELHLPAQVRRLLRPLSPVATDVVHLVALAGDEVASEEISAVIERLHGFPVPASELERLVDLGLLVRGLHGYRLKEGRACDDLVGWLRPGARQRIHQVIAELVTLSPPRRVRHLIGAGRHRLACEVGCAEIAQAQARGDDDAVQELVEAMLELPASLQPRSLLRDTQSLQRSERSAR